MRNPAVCSDPKDQLFLHLVQSGKPELLTSGDQDLLVLAGVTSFLIETSEAYSQRIAGHMNERTSKVTIDESRKGAHTSLQFSEDWLQSVAGLPARSTFLGQARLGLAIARSASQRANGLQSLA
jgi:hypothetical protein